MTNTMNIACDWYYANGENKSHTAIVHGVSPRTIGRWLEKYNQTTKVAEVVNSNLNLLDIGTAVRITASEEELKDFGISNLAPNDIQTIDYYEVENGIYHYVLSSGYIIKTDMCVDCDYEEETYEFLPVGSMVRVTADDYELKCIGVDGIESGEVYTIKEIDEDDEELCYQLGNGNWVSNDMVVPFSEETDEFLPVGSMVRVTASRNDLEWINAGDIESGNEYTIIEVDEDDEDFCYQLDNQHGHWVNKDMVEPVTEPCKLIDIEDDLEYTTPEELASYMVFAQPHSVTLTKLSVNGSVDQITVGQSDKRFEEIKSALDGFNSINQDDLKTAYRIASVKEQLAIFSDGNIHVNPGQNKVFYDDGVHSFEWSGRLVDRIIGALKSGSDELQSLINFTKRLSRNPSENSIQQLYNLLDFADVEIDQDGYVIAFKKIKEDWTDVYTGMIDNSIGAKPFMPRHMIDENPDKTCSRGLHICAQSYLDSYFGSRVVKVKVDPKDVVSVPSDYNFAKCRVCEYEVIEEVANW